MRNIFCFFAFLVASSQLLVANPVSAAVRCEIQYGGQEVCVRTGQLQIDKKVFDLQNNRLVDNMGLNDHKFAPGEEVNFKLKIKNVGDATFETVNVMDILPNMFESAGGNPFFQLKDLKAGEEREQGIKVKVVSADKFPSDKSIVCVVNAAEAVSGDNKDRDTAQVCMERKVLAAERLEKGAPPTELPPTGPENWLLIFLGSILAGTTGIFLVKLSQKGR